MKKKAPPTNYKARYKEAVKVLRECAKLAKEGPFLGADAARTLLKQWGELQ